MTQAEERRMRRIFEQGFAAAERLTRDQRKVVEDENSSTSLNPHKVEPERSRWTEGFDRARSNNGKPPSKPKSFGRKGAG